ncbi:MAG: DHA1 family bicyclomycin/chloramphenicol resistance-like MFS transporter [Verrucomicrobiales bacterium]|jgi:DHA1 family bicyclomycin/chloramphenicol resistance-like MFS transporter
MMMSLITATIAISIDTVLPAFDEIETQFGLDPDNSSISLTITVFLAAMGLSTLVWGPISDRYGRKRTMYASLVLFIGGAIVATLATSFSTFLMGRALWGAAAAGPRTVSLAIIRDAYDGDIMSRVMSLTTAVFLIVPVLAPALGEGLLLIGSWRLTTMAAVFLGAIAALWLTRLRETLAPEDVLPLEFGRVGRAARAVLTNRRTVLFTIATTLSYGAFFPWLGSSTQMIGEIYGRDDQFALFFGVNAAFMALVIVIVERLVKRYSTIPVLLAQSAILVFVAGAYVVWTAAGDDVVNFWGWFALVSVMTALNAGTTPLMQTLAMEPMGKIAGTASSVTGAIVFIGGALLGAIIDHAISDTVTPFGVGFLIYSGLALAAMLFARSGERL